MSERDSAAPVRLVIDNAELLPQPLSEDVDGGGTSSWPPAPSRLA